MVITASELKKELEYYLKMAADEDVYITQNGKAVAKLTAPFQQRTDTAGSLFGILPQTTKLEEAEELRDET